MKKRLIALLTGVSLIFYSDYAYGKSTWLKCGEYEINLDEVKREFNTTISNKFYQGKAVFFPSQINFEVQWFSLPGGGGLRYDFAIDRKTLDYTQKSMRRLVITTTDTGWVEAGEEKGKCIIIKNPSTGNKI